MTTSGLAAVHAAAQAPASVPSVSQGQAQNPPASVPAEANNEQAIAAARAEGHAAGLSAGAVAERARCSAILSSEHAAGREALAQYFAFETEMSAEAASAALAKSPKVEPKGSRLEGNVPQPQVTSGAGGSPADDYEAGRQAVLARKPAAA